MARNTLEAVFGALGSGLVGYGRDQKRRYDESQDAADREAERERERVRNAFTLAQMGFDPTEDLQRRSRAVSQSAQMAQGAPTVPGMPGMSAVASALASGGRALDTDISGGRRLTVEGKEYVQPFSRTTQGQAQAADRQAETERLRTQQGRKEELQLQNTLAIARDAAARTPAPGELTGRDKALDDTFKSLLVEATRNGQPLDEAGMRTLYTALRRVFNPTPGDSSAVSPPPPTARDFKDEIDAEIARQSQGNQKPVAPSLQQIRETRVEYLTRDGQMTIAEAVAKLLEEEKRDRAAADQQRLAEHIAPFPGAKFPSGRF